jgi:hypothetical protein
MPTRFEIERDKVARLMERLGAVVEEYRDPNTSRAGESGADVIAVVDGCHIGIQITDLDTGDVAGEARAAEVRLARDPERPYGTWAQNDPAKMIAAIVRSIERKSRMSFAGFDDFWLLICAGLPQMGAIAATLLFTPAIDVGALDAATASIISGSKYKQAFIHGLLGVEQGALYQWRRGANWSKSTIEFPASERGPNFWDVLPVLRGTGSADR